MTTIKVIRLYYMATGETYRVNLRSPIMKIAALFDVSGIQAAVRGAQSGVVNYPEFVRLSSAAGCMGYMVWIRGRHVQYLGRRGEVHIEHFPVYNKSKR